MNGTSHKLPRSFASYGLQTFSSLRSAQQHRPTLIRPHSSSFHSGAHFCSKRHKAFFQSNAKPYLTNSGAKSLPSEQVAAGVGQSTQLKKNSLRSSAGKKSLRRVALEAERSRDGKGSEKHGIGSTQVSPKTVTAVCTAEEYDIGQVAHILKGNGYALDPYGTDLYPQVVHVVIPIQNQVLNQEHPTYSTGDLFVFPSGTIVAWSVPGNILSKLISKTLRPAAFYPLDQVEEEDLEYIEDPKKSNSHVKGDRIILGTRPQTGFSRTESSTTSDADTESLWESDDVLGQSRNIDTVLAKIAFSSGLARSTKLAVLESLLSEYFQSTRSIPEDLSRGGRIPFTRRFILQKTGQLLGIRAQLNLYAELTDSLPDIFWDSRHELGLEGYYDEVGRALDIGVRIKVLNEKMDYAQEIASVLRQQLSEQHGIRLEWIIIILIAVEVIFAIERELYEYGDKRAARETVEACRKTLKPPTRHL